MFCNYCRTLNPDDAVYCRTCGRTIRFSSDAPPTENAQPANGTTLPTVAPPMTPSASDHAAANNPELSTAAPFDDSAHADIDPSATDIAADDANSAPPKPGPPAAPVTYGTLGQRFTAYFADLAVVYLLVFIAYFVSGAIQSPLPSGDGGTEAMFLVCLFLYMIIAQATYHTTFGKYVHGLEVRSEQPSRKYPAFWRIVVRETIGRVLASLFWGLGYWFTNRNPQKQAWSDQIAGTIVTVRQTNKVLVRAFTAFALIALITDIAAIGYGQYKNDRDKRYVALQSEMQAASNGVVTARRAVDQQLSDTRPINNVGDFIAWQNEMRSLTQDLDRYEAQIDRVQALIQQGISENLAASDTERKQLIVLKQVYDIRKREAEKLRQEANLVDNSNYSPASMTNLRDGLELMDSDINALEKQASQLLAQIGEK